MTVQQLQDWAFPATHNATSVKLKNRITIANNENVKYQSSIEVEDSISQKQLHLLCFFFGTHHGGATT